MKHIVGAFTRTADGRIVPQFTTSGGHYVVGPADFAKIYIFLPRSMEQGSISLSSLIQTSTPKT